MEAAALHIKRFHSLQRQLPVPESDVQLMRDAEAQLLQAVTAQLDAAITQAALANQRQQHQQQTDNSSALAAAAAGEGGSSFGPTIARCCQLMNLLGHADTGLSRYVTYLTQSLTSDCIDALRSVVVTSPGGIEDRAVAINVLSSLLGRAAAALDSAEALADSLFSTDEGPAAVLAAVHSVADKTACKLVTSYARSGRLQALMNAREAITASVSGNVGGSSSSSVDSVLAGNELSAAAAGAMLAALEDEKNDAPLAPPRGSVTSSVYRGVDYSDPATYDALLDETAIMLQRCTSYFRIIFGRAAAIDSARGHNSNSASGSSDSHHHDGSLTHRDRGQSSSSSSALVSKGRDHGSGKAGASIADGSPSAGHVSTSVSAEARLRAAGGKMRESAGELGGILCLAEEAALSQGVNKAIAIDELVPDGAAGSGVEIIAIGTANDASVLLQAIEGGTPTAAAANSEGVVSADAGAGAAITSFIEDSFYVCLKSLQRSFATGDANVASSTVNTIVLILSDRLGAELEARLRIALDENAAAAAAASGGAGSTMSGGQHLVIAGGVSLVVVLKQ